MTPMKTILLSSFLAFGLLFLCIPAGAHVEKSMPDSVAEMEYRILLEFKPADYRSRIKLGMVLLNQNKFREAEKEFRRALMSSPDNQQAHTGLALLHLKQNEEDKAIELIRKAVSIDPEQGIVYLHYGYILESTSRFEEAFKMYQKGLTKLDPSPDSEDSHHRDKLNKAVKNIELKIKKSTSIK